MLAANRAFRKSRHYLLKIKSAYWKAFGILYLKLNDIEFESGLTLQGIPYISKHPFSKIKLGKNVTIWGLRKIHFVVVTFSALQYLRSMVVVCIFSGQMGDTRCSVFG